MTKPLYTAGTPVGVGGHVNLSGGVVGVLNSTGRSSGRTTRQIQALPIGGWYFVHHYAVLKTSVRRCRFYLDDPIVNRPDIEIKLAETLKDYYQYHGCVISGFDVDHYVWETMKDPDIAEGARRMWSCVKPWAVNEAAKLTSPTQRSTICPCGIHRLDCEYHK